MSTGLHNIQYTTQNHLPGCQPRRRAARVGLKGGRNRRYSLAERLAARTVKGPSCWIVQGYQLLNGYVQLKTKVGGRMESVFAHRLAYELARGPIPAGMVVMHACDAPNCVNPDHLSVGTQAENIRDSVKKGRHGAHLRTGIRLNGMLSRRLGVFDPVAPVFERVPHVELPFRGELHLDECATGTAEPSMQFGSTEGC